MTQPFLALIVPVTGGEGGSPPGIWGGGNVPMPTPPIHLPPQGGGSPPGIWGGMPWPTPPIYYPPGGSPPGIWGPNDPRPGWGLPGGGGSGNKPPGIWGGAPPFVDNTLPIAPPETPPGADGGWAWSPMYGWVWVPEGSGGKPKPPEGGSGEPPTVDNTLPGSQPKPDNTLPPSPPTAQPKRP